MVWQICPFLEGSRSDFYVSASKAAVLLHQAEEEVLSATKVGGRFRHLGKSLGLLGFQIHIVKLVDGLRWRLPLLKVEGN